MFCRTSSSRSFERSRGSTTRRSEIATEVEEPDPWQRERLLANVARLSPASRAVVTLHYLDELPLADVAAILDISLGTVKSRLAYGLAQLRKETQ
jgi:RNA polymerase sigma-70 factor (ECF subfamily)